MLLQVVMTSVTVTRRSLTGSATGVFFFLHPNQPTWVDVESRLAGWLEVWEYSVSLFGSWSQRERKQKIIAANPVTRDLMFDISPQALNRDANDGPTAAALLLNETRQSVRPWRSGSQNTARPSQSRATSVFWCAGLLLRCPAFQAGFATFHLRAVVFASNLWVQWVRLSLKRKIVSQTQPRQTYTLCTRATVLARI